MTSHPRLKHPLWKLFFVCPQTVPPGSNTLRVSGDNNFKLYLDGVLRSTGNQWWRVVTTPLPDWVGVVAIEADKAAMSNGGIIASDLAGQLWTNTSWRCSNTYLAGWMGAGFNISASPSFMAAYIGANNNGELWETLSQIGNKASWIWTSRIDYNSYTMNATGYCRISLSKCN